MRDNQSEITQLLAEAQAFRAASTLEKAKIQELSNKLKLPWYWDWDYLGHSVFWGGLLLLR
jgi:hypothetical protein